MPRQARKKGEFLIYHIMQRGNEKKDLFLSDEDRIRFIETLERMKKKYNFLLYAYCLMANHVHLLLGDNGNDISKIVQSINVSYAYYFNQKYNRCGHLFQDRFRSELVDSERYLLEVSRYIHNNPVKAGLVMEPSSYPWSSYLDYIGKEPDMPGVVEKGKILSAFSNRQGHAVKNYMNFVLCKEGKKLVFLDVNDDADKVKDKNYVHSLEQGRLKVRELAESKNINFEDLLAKFDTRNELMVEVRKNSSLTLKQIGELFGGMSESRVSRVIKSHVRE